MFAIGQGEIDNSPPLGKTIKCFMCKKRHKVGFAKDKNGNETKMLAFYKCGKDSYLCGINGKDIRRRGK